MTMSQDRRPLILRCILINVVRGLLYQSALCSESWLIYSLINNGINLQRTYHYMRLQVIKSSHPYQHVFHTIFTVRLTLPVGLRRYITYVVIVQTTTNQQTGKTMLNSFKTKQRLLSI